MSRISLQTFTIRKEINKDASDSLQKVRDIGLRTIELARVDFSRSNIEQIAPLCRQTGIDVGSVQIKLTEMEKDRAWLKKMLDILGCRYTVVSVVSFAHLRKGIEGIKSYCRRLEDMGRYLKDEGKQLVYHHHNYEFVPIDGVLPIDYILEHTDPSLVGLCADTYWIQRGGRNPADFIRACAGRVRVVHLRDFTLTPPLLFPKITDTNLGGGALDFSGIIRACIESGVDYMPIEQDSKAPFDDIERSIEHLKALGFEDLL